MGKKDIERQKSNVFKIKLLGGQIIPVVSGNGTLKDAMNEALRDWVANVENTYYLIGTAAGPHPYPTMVRDFQSIIGEEAKSKFLIKKYITRRLGCLYRRIKCPRFILSFFG